MRDRLTQALPAAALAWAAVLLPGSAAFGHPSGVVPQARLDAEGRQVSVEWWAAPDDVADLGVGLGFLGDGAPPALRGETDDLPSAEEVTRFARSTELETYLLDNVQVSQDGHPCDARVTVADDVLVESVRYSFRCPQTVEQVAVRITLLHDRDELYRTYSIDGTIWSPVHTVHQPEHVWDATLVGADAGAGWRHLRWAGVGLVLATCGAVLWWMRPGDRRSGGDRWSG
ncbi:hypothetical protein [Nitriliruptor alkaliphilus]|uniref:hypothetical protein n=1 Tax=Nitriliruptor alkaliphilus TaxID=427918 RepID=UPI00069621B3|nr:hypothetical protein [Nitriliruptor alkaliphilus]